MKKSANISAAIIILCLSFLVFCACAIDAGYVVLSRYKVQKLTETIALYMVSTLKSKSHSERTVDAVEPIKTKFENLYSSDITGYYKLKISEININDDDTIDSPKIKINIEADIPTVFLKFAGIGSIKIIQTSYAIAQEKELTPRAQDLNSFTFEIPNLLTDKAGYDFKVKYNKNYFIFAGIKDYENNTHWTDISSAGNGVEIEHSIIAGSDTFSIKSIEGSIEGELFDLSKDGANAPGIVKYIKIYNEEYTPPPEGETAITEEEDEETDEEELSVLEDETPLESASAGDVPKIIILNYARLIKGSDF